MQSAYPAEPIGEITTIAGQEISIALYDITMLADPDSGYSRAVGEYGSCLSIPYGERQLYASVFLADSTDNSHLKATLFGETPPGEERFVQGISRFPVPGTLVYATPDDVMAQIYGASQPNTFTVGYYRDAPDIPCRVDINKLLTQPSAVLGTTGSGKSATVTAIIHSLLQHGRESGHEKWNPNILIFDPHGEYGEAFANHSRLSAAEGGLTLPYWMLDLRETVNLLVDDSDATASAEEDILRRALVQARYEAANQLGYDAAVVSADSPLPYQLGDAAAFNELGRMSGNVLYEEGLIGKINRERPLNIDLPQHVLFNKLIRKIDTLASDTRLAFLMKEPDMSENPLPDIISKLTGAPQQPVIIDLSGMPNDVASILCATVARTLFNLRIWQTPEERAATPLLLVCEEAQRYIPERENVAHRSARQAIQRIAKEGRKYGVGLMLVSQRPSDIDFSVLSQCTSWFVLRLNNPNDRQQVHALLPDSFSSLSGLLPSLRQREALFVGNAALLPASLHIRDLSDDELPNSGNADYITGWKQERQTDLQLKDLVDRWVYQKNTGLPPRKHDASEYDSSERDDSEHDDSE